MISVDVVLGSLFLEQGAVSLRQAKLGQDGVEEVWPDLAAYQNKKAILFDFIAWVGKQHKGVHHQL